MDYDVAETVSQGDINFIQKHLDSGYDINSINFKGRGLIFYGLRSDSNKVVSFLVPKGAKLNITDNDGRTPLLVALAEGHDNMVKCLLDVLGLT